MKRYSNNNSINSRFKESYIVDNGQLYESENQEKKKKKNTYVLDQLFFSFTTLLIGLC